MSADKNGSKRSTTTKERNLLSKTSTKKPSKERVSSKTTHEEAQKKSTNLEEKDDIKKPIASTDNSFTKTKSVSLRKTNEKLPKNTSVPTRNISNSSKSSGSSRESLNKLKSNTPTTSTSSRVKKSQYFPSKNLYSNALKSVEMQSKVLEHSTNESNKKHIEKTSSRSSTAKKSTSNTNQRNVIKKPERVKLLPKQVPSNIGKTLAKPSNDEENSKQTPRDSSPDTSSMLERPRTATLRKGSIVNENIVGPEAPKYVKNVPAIKEAALPNETELKADDNYEDDFESYESDFEAASSSEDVNLGISGSTSSSAEDISENNDPSPLPLQKESKRVITSAGTDGERKLDSGTFELTDFKHRQILKYIEDTMKKEDAILEQENLKEKGNHPSLSDEGFEDQKSIQFINFSHAKKQCEKRKASAARKKRGEELLSMIKLDAANFTIFDSPSVSYDTYISSYGQCNSVQASVQTGDDDLCEEVQTDSINMCTKWTQMPSMFSTFDQSNENFWPRYRSEHKGAGDANMANDIKNESLMEVNEVQITNFIQNCGELMLRNLSEQSITNKENTMKSKNNLPFSKGYLRFDTSKDIFQNTTVQNLSVHSKNVGKVLSVHLKNDMDTDLVRSIICIWDIGDLDGPRIVLVSFGQVRCCTFCIDSDKYVLAGQEDGAVLVWNVEDKQKHYDILSRTPSFITPIGSGHVSKVVSVQPIPQDQNTSLDTPENQEICSLDESGSIILWTLYVNTDLTRSSSDIILINTQMVHLQDIYPQFSDLTCSDCIVMENHVYISSSYGFILHHLLKSNQTGIKMFVPDMKIKATCLESCPFSPQYFVAGYSNGDISLFSRTTDRPLLVLQNKEQIDSASVQMIQWSKTKPFIFYAKDSKNTVHVWDLCKSDMYPEYSIPFPEKISAIKLSPVLNVEVEEAAYMLIGTKNGEIYLHLLNKEYGQDNLEKYQKQVKIFLNYVNRL